MTDTFDQGSEQPQEEGGNANLKYLREQAEEAKALREENAALKRASAIDKAGIDADHPLGKFFVDHYDGDITDTTALVAKAQEMGVPIKGAPAFDGTEGSESTEPPQNEMTGRQVLEPTGTEQRRALAGEDPNLGDVREDPRKVALQQAEDAVAKGATFEQAGAHMISQLAKAASTGDTRVLIREERDSNGRVAQRWQ